jgi:hypothetical protein
MLFVGLLNSNVIPHEAHMVNLHDKNRSAYSLDELARLEKSLEVYWTRMADLETSTVVDLEKHLWIANGAAATAAVAFVQERGFVSLGQHAGAWAFACGLLSLVVLKFLSAYMSSRELARFHEAKSQFDAEERTDFVFREEELRDATAQYLKKAYLWCLYVAGTAFVVGIVLTLVGVACAV